MMRQYYYKFLFILAVIVVFFYQIYPLEKKIKRGLDLQGGVHVVLEVEEEGKGDAYVSDLADRALEVIRNRIDSLGVTEPVIQKQGMRRIIVDLPGVQDPDRALEIIGQTALLEFKLVSDDQKMMEKAMQGEIPEGYELLYHKEKDERGIYRETNPILVKVEPELTGRYVEDAFVGYDNSGFPDVNLIFNKEGAGLFEDITSRNVNRRLAIVLDGVVRSAPVIRERIGGGRANITGRFSVEEARTLAIVLRAGALPAKVEMIYREVVGPTLGRENITQGFKSAIYGSIVVLVFMLIYFAAFGLLADFALALNILILLGIVATVKGVLTLPGIAGIALTSGMAVDANILIFERIREEIKTGKSPKSSIDSGYKRAWSAIIDSNITTLIVGLILFFLGEGPVKGFGLTLSIGILANLFTAVFVTKSIVDWVMVTKKIEKVRI
jgi:protein-export membrane protein SecD